MVSRNVRLWAAFDNCIGPFRLVVRTMDHHLLPPDILLHEFPPLLLKFGGCRGGGRYVEVQEIPLVEN